MLGDDQSGTVLQVPSGETLELTVQLDYTDRWQSPERLERLRNRFRQTGKYLTLGSAVVLPVSLGAMIVGGFDLSEAQVLAVSTGLALSLVALPIGASLWRTSSSDRMGR